MSRIIIFGGEGFIGSALRMILDQHAIAYYAPSQTEIDLEYEDAPEQINAMVKDGDTIIMIAALTAEHGEGYQLTDANIHMAVNLLDGIEGKDIAHFVYLSSDSVYGNFDEIMTESTPLSPLSLYGMMHMIRERMFVERIAPERLTILRPCSVYGKGDTHNAYGINQFVRTAKENGFIKIFGNGEELRSNIHVDDLAAIIMASAVERISGVFNANCGGTYSYIDLANIVQETLADNGITADIILKERTIPIAHRCVNNEKLLKSFSAPRLAPQGIRELCAQCV